MTLFFFLSGYLITTLMRQEIEQTGGLSIRLFYVRRALRIFPTCYLVLAAAAAYGWYSWKMDTWYLIGQVFNLTNYQLIWAGWEAPIAPHTDVYWSLAVEEHFYLAFTALVVALSRGRSRVALSAATVGKSVLGLTLTAGTLTVTVPALMYNGIERPMGRLRKRFNAPATSVDTTAGSIKSLA